ncbi:MAG: peroxiredoxin-like family protein [Gemmataceae bacterium]
MACRAHLGEVIKVQSEIERLGARVLVVSFTPPAKVKAYVERKPLPFPVVSDPDMASYRAFALGRARVRSFFRPSVLWRFLKMMFAGWLPRKPGKGEDLLQLGGDFILDKDQRLVYAHPSTNAADRPSAATLLKELGARY